MLDGKNITFSLLWEIRSIFKQNCFIVSALQHGRRENPLAWGNAANLEDKTKQNFRFCKLTSGLETGIPHLAAHALITLPWESHA